MPTYVYRRQDGTTFEVFQRISDDALETDPETGQPIERVIGGGAGLIFKGTGFYLTDYARKSGDTSSDKASESKTESMSESKSAEKTNGSSKTESKSKPDGD